MRLTAVVYCKFAVGLMQMCSTSDLQYRDSMLWICSGALLPIAINAFWQYCCRSAVGPI